MKQSKKNNLFKYLLFTLFSCISIVGYAQNSATEGTDFYVSFGRNYDNKSLCQIRYVVTQTTHITAQYGDGSYLKYDKDGVEVEENNVLHLPGVYTKEVNKDLCYINGASSNAANDANKMLKITSADANIGVFAINLLSATTDATTVLPTTALGTDYTILSHDGYNDDISGNGARLLIIAIEDNTVFSIVDKANSSIVPNFTLAKGKVYHYLNKNDLTSFSVKSNKPIAVFSTVDCGNMVTDGGCDHNFEQMWPTETAGKNFFVWNMSPGIRDKIKIVAINEEPTTVSITGNTSPSRSNAFTYNNNTATVLNKNGVMNFWIDPNIYINNSPAPIKISADKPILVEHFLGHAPSIKWLSSKEQTITKAVISPFVPVEGVSVITKHQLHLMVKKGTEAETHIKETRGTVVTDNIQLQYYTNTADPDYVIASKDYTAIDDVIIEITNEAGFIAYMAGFGSAESYIFTAGAGAFDLQAYFTVGTKTNPYNDTQYSATSTMTHTYDDMDNIVIKRTLEKSFASVKWLLNGTEYTVTENSNTENSWSLPASALNKGENELIMSVRYTGSATYTDYKSKIWRSHESAYPDNIEDPSCSVVNEGTTWSITESLPINKTDRIHNYGPLVVGNIDGDAEGTVELIGLKPDDRTGTVHGGYLSYGVVIFKYEGGLVKKVRDFNLKDGTSTASYGSMAIARYNDRGYIVLIGVLGAQRYLYAYDPYGDLIWKSDKPCSRTDINHVSIADFNNDGIPEVYVDNQIFSLASGKLLCQGLTTGNYGKSSGTSGAFPIAIDIDNDPEKTLELVAGTQVYKVIIPQNATTSAGCSIDLVPELEMIESLPANSAKDGMTQVVDIDNDGQLEVVVSAITNGRHVLYVWKILPENKSYIMGSYTSPLTGVGNASVPMIGNLDKDANLEVTYIISSVVGSVRTNRMYALKLDLNATKGNMLKQKWELNHTDNSGCTGMTLFDFDLNGTAEIVYRDEQTLRIINGSGSTPVTTNTFDNVKSGTLREYPIIADIDGDGQVEIIIQGWDGISVPEVSDGVLNQSGYLRVFKSKDFRWASARPVWNQYNYNAVNVNADLTIPSTQFPITTKFNGIDGIPSNGDDIRVFNNFRQQQTYLNRNGVAYLPAPKILVVDPNSIEFIYNANEDRLYISNLKVKNEGQVSADTPLWITVYQNTVSTTPSKKYSYKYDNLSNIVVNETRVIDFTIDEFSKWMPTDNLIIKVNDSGNTLNDQAVCDDCCTNNESGPFINIHFNELAWADKYKHCENGTVNFDAKLLSGTGVEYKWFKPNNMTAEFSSQRNPQLTPLSLTDGGQYVLIASNIGNNSNLSVTYKLPYLSVAPSVMHWKPNTTNNNWNDLANWLDGTKTPVTAVPAGCTTVHIPAVADNYPSLSETASTSITATDWSLYGQPEADKIVYHYGSEVAYPHKLKYNKAYVQYNFGYYNTYTSGQPTQNKEAGSPVLKRDIWYPLAAPLKEMVSGDFAFGGYPATWQAMPDILSGSSNLNSVNFSKNLGKNDQPLAAANNMIALKAPLWSTAKGSSDQKHTENLQGVLEIPYFENDGQKDDHPSHSYDPISTTSTYYYYDNQTLQQLGSPVGTLKRKNDNAYRFIFEKDDKTVTNVTINGVSVPCYSIEVTPNNSKQVLIGNPFIASISMDHFQKANSTLIAGSTFNAYNPTDKDWKQYTYSASSVNPLQAFVVTLNTASKVTLNFPLEGDRALTGKGGSKIPRRLETPGAIAVTVSDASGRAGDYAELTSGEEQTINVSKLISEEGHALPEAFFIDPTGNSYNLIQTYEQAMNEVGIGVKCSDTQNELTLTFDHIEAFSQLNNTHPVLVDKLLGIEQDLTENSSYRFRQHTSANPQSQYADKKRFAIRFNEDSSVNNNDNLQVIYTNSHLEIKTTIKAIAVEVYSLSGQLLFNSGVISTTNYHQDLPLAQGGYIVKVKTEDNKSNSKKIMAL